MTKYQQFRDEYLKSGLTQKAYAQRIGKSPSVVSNYLRKAREEDQQVTEEFTPIKIDLPSNKSIIISLPSGTLIEIPL